jgi:hypothetical protein
MKHGGPAPVRRFLPELINLVWNGNMNAGKVFDLYLPDQPRVLWGASDLRINFIVRWLTRRAKRIPYDLALRPCALCGEQ